MRTASEDTAVLYEQIEQSQRLYAAMEQLTEIQRNRVYLYYFRGLNHREIAEMEGVIVSATNLTTGGKGGIIRVYITVCWLSEREVTMKRQPEHRCF